MIAPIWPLYACRTMERARLMRWVICAAVMVALAPSAFAGDFDILRGSKWPDAHHWSGVYGGGQGGYIERQCRFQQRDAAATRLQSARYDARTQTMQISNWTVLGNGNLTNATGYGGFVGYNIAVGKPHPRH